MGLARLSCVAGSAILLSIVAAGCGGRSGVTIPPATAARGPDAALRTPVAAVPESVRSQLLDGAIGVLGRLEDFNETAAYRQVFDRINQWSHSGVAWPEWIPDPLVKSLPERFQPFVGERALAGSSFEAPGDVLFLRDQRWLHDLALSARGDAVDDLAVAEALFNWTVRSLAIVADPPASPSAANPGTRWYQPGEILLAGRASGPQRAWIFLELIRHAGLDAVMIATREPATGEVRPWIPAVVVDGEAYLFDTTYGMPIPGPDGRGIATARAAASNPAVLAAMNLPGRGYPVQAEAVRRLAVLVAATPESLSHRMERLESNLVGRRSMRVTIDPSGVAARAVEALPDGSTTAAEAGLWEFPFETLLARRSSRAGDIGRTAAMELATLQVSVVGVPDGKAAVGRQFRPLYVGRLREFRGDLDGPEGAKAAYLLARPSSRQIREIVAATSPQQAEPTRRLYESLKEDATFALGLLMLRERQFEAADDYLGRMTLEAHPDGRWADAARAALADVAIATGRLEEAGKLLEADESPQRFGSRLRAARLVAGPPGERAEP